MTVCGMPVSCGVSPAKSLLRGVLPIILFVISSGLSIAAQQLDVGVAKTSISPPIGPEKPPVWIAGYNNGRQATSLHDDLWARCMLFRWKNTGKSKCIALVSLDLIGYSYPETLKIRALFKQKYPTLPVDYILIACTHTHEGPDTLGLWGRTNRESGANPQYLAFINEVVARTVAAAFDNRKRARLHAGFFELEGLIRDIRPPQVIDNTVLFMHAEDVSGKAIGTLVNFSCHPETLGPDNTQITSDYPHFLREHLERIAGGITIFFVGSIGGLLTPAEMIYDRQAGHAAEEYSWRKAQIIGETLASKVAGKIKGSTVIKADRLDFRAEKIYIPLTNLNFRLAAALRLFERPLFTDAKLDEFTVSGEKMGISAAIPQGKDLQTEVSLITMGPLQILGVPGEIYPEIIVGGIPKPQEITADFPGAFREEPPLRTLMQGNYRLVFGLANDEIGYIIPKTEWDEKAPFTYSQKSAPYGEINSCGYNTAPILYSAIRRLLRSREK